VAARHDADGLGQAADPTEQTLPVPFGLRGRLRLPPEETGTHGPGLGCRLGKAVAAEPAPRLVAVAAESEGTESPVDEVFRREPADRPLVVAHPRPIRL